MQTPLVGSVSCLVLNDEKLLFGKENIRYLRDALG